MRILVSNDDGIYAKGIIELANALSEIGTVTVVAPKTEQSAVGHAITMKVPLRVYEHNFGNNIKAYAIEGTPADCIKIAIKNILTEKPDIIVSGINHGSNTAISIIYSGTVSAAREAAIMGYPAIAISITDHRPTSFNVASNIAKDLVKKVLNNKLPVGTILNVNVPNIPLEDIKGVLPTHQGLSKWNDVYEKRVDPYGNDYYWLTGQMEELDTEIYNDQIAVKNNYVAVTPVHFNLTDYKAYEELKKWHLKQ